MEKDARIQKLLVLLQLEKRGWVIVDHWDADLCAVGIATAGFPRKLVYVSVLGMPDGNYYFECESPTGAEATEYQVTQEGNADSIDKLLVVLERHLST